MGQNDSILTFGLELAEETEKSASEIVSGSANQQPAPQAAEHDQAALEEARAMAQQARDHEAAENAKALALEHEGPER
jgi:hypothetical protein